jgi:hypothetical protein
MTESFSAAAVATQVLEHLERRRAQLVAADDDYVKQEIEAALVPIEQAYAEAELPAPYFAALKRELVATVPQEWLRAARRYTTKEGDDFGLWRGGDPVARITYVLVGLVLGGLILRAPFIPIWEKWFPFALAVGAWWLPDAQVAYHKRRYARALGAIVARLSRAQPLLDETISVKALLQQESSSK